MHETNTTQCLLSYIKVKSINITEITSSPVPQIYVADLAHDELFPYHLTAEEVQQRFPVCLGIVGADTLTQTVHITLTTASTTNGTYTSATGKTH